MTSGHIIATLGVVLILVGQVCPKPTDELSTAQVPDNTTSGDAESVQVDPLDYVKQVNRFVGDKPIQFRSATDDEQRDEGEDHVLAEADAEYNYLLGDPEYDYEEYSSDEDENDDEDRSEQSPLRRSGNLILSPSTYQGSGLVSQISGFPANFPATQEKHVITQTLNPAYGRQQVNKASREKASVARLLYLLGTLSKPGRQITYGLGSSSGHLQAGNSGGLLSYGQTTIRQPVISNGYGSVGGNVATSGSSGSAYDYLSSSNQAASSIGSSYDVSGLGGQSLIQLIRPIARFVAVQKTSPQKHWLSFLNKINQAQVSGSGAYQTLNKQINRETKRQQRLIALIKRYRQIASTRRNCAA